MEEEAIRFAAGRLRVAPSAGTATWEGQPLSLSPLALRALATLASAAGPLSNQQLVDRLGAPRLSVVAAVQEIRHALAVGCTGELTLPRHAAHRLVVLADELRVLTAAASKVEERLLAEYVARIAGEVRGTVAAFVPPGFVAWIESRGATPVRLDAGPVDVDGLFANLTAIREHAARVAVQALRLKPSAPIALVMPSQAHAALQSALKRARPWLEQVDRNGFAVHWTPGFDDAASS
jgi:hypothetical protein